MVRRLVYSLFFFLSFPQNGYGDTEVKSLGWANLLPYSTVDKKKHPVSNLLDGNPKTAWCLDGSLRGRSLEIEILGDEQIDRIEIANGYQKDDAIYRRNARIKTLGLKLLDRNGRVLSDSKTTAADVPFTMMAIELNNSDLPEPVARVKLEFRELYPGTASKDLCLSELVLKHSPSQFHFPDPIPLSQISSEDQSRRAKLLPTLSQRDFTSAQKWPELAALTAKYEDAETLRKIFAVSGTDGAISTQYELTLFEVYRRHPAFFLREADSYFKHDWKKILGVFVNESSDIDLAELAKASSRIDRNRPEYPILEKFLKEARQKNKELGM